MHTLLLPRVSITDCYRIFQISRLPQGIEVDSDAIRRAYFVLPSVAFAYVAVVVPHDLGNLLLKIEIYLAFATSTAYPCFRYNYSETYTIDKSSLPEGVSVSVSMGKSGTLNSGLPLLVNVSSKILTLDGGGYSLELMNGKEYKEQSGYVNSRSESSPDFLHARIDILAQASLVRVGKVIDPRLYYGSNDSPKQPQPVNFDISGQYDSRPIVITGTLSYTLFERDCSTGKVVTADTAVSNPATPPTPTTAVSFVQNLSFRMRSVAVSNLQQFLVSQGLLAADLVTGYFGPKTLAAVKAFQRQQNITPVSGFFGPLTRTKANAVASGAAY